VQSHSNYSPPHSVASGGELGSLLKVPLSSLFSEDALPSLRIPPPIKEIKPLWHFSIQGDKGTPPPNIGDYVCAEGIRKLIDEHLPGVRIRSFSIKYDVIDECLIDTLNREASGLVIGGGGLYSSKHHYESGWYLRCRTHLFAKIQVPIFLVGLGNNSIIDQESIDTTFGPLTPVTLESIYEVNSRASLSSVRDQRTANLLRRHGITCPSGISVVADPASFFFPPSTNHARPLFIGINVAQHGPTLVQERQRLAKVFTAAIIYALEKHSLPPLFICHGPEEAQFCKELLPKIDNSDLIDTQDLIKLESAYSHCALVLAVKMHPSILAWSKHIPFIMIDYDEKHRSFRDLVGVSQKRILLPELTSDIVISEIDRVMSNYQPIVSTLKNAHDYQKEKMREFMSRFGSIVTDSCS
jgi:polysaccharide pyruvyl transferase WcaK-like protein